MQRKVVVLAAGAALLVGGYVLARCPRSETPLATDAARATDDAGAPGGELVSEKRGLAGPVAAAVTMKGDVLVAALDGTGLRVQRMNGAGEVGTSKVVLGDVVRSPDSDLRVFAAPEGGFVLWRGLHEGKLGRLLLSLDPDLKVRATTPLSSSTACATRTELWTSDGAKATAHPFAGGAEHSVTLPPDVDATLLCDPAAAFAVLDADERTAVLALDGSNAKADVLREKDFGEDEQRELSEYVVDGAAGFVRVASSGALAIREVTGGKAGPLHKLKTTIERDNDVVAVDASRESVVIVYTDEVEEDAGDRACTRVVAVRVDRKTWDETTVELSPGRCGFEVGPFFTSAFGDGVAVAWPERNGGVGKARAPVVSLATALVGAKAAPLARIDRAAEEIVDAACDPNGCWAVALHEGAAHVLRYGR